MLPAGMVADLVPASARAAFQNLHPAARTVARLLVGACSCDLVRLRANNLREDERHLRERYRTSGIPRDQIIVALERHRRGAGSLPPPEGWPRALAGFVSEHSRNAGPTLYHLEFSADPTRLIKPGEIHQVKTAQVLDHPEQWLREGPTALVAR